MHTIINSPFSIGSKNLSNRLIQGPLAGYSCAPFRALFYQFMPPAYCVSEMISAVDVLSKHAPESRYRYRCAVETTLAYQLSGNNPGVLADAAMMLEAQGADIIDINCGCPKSKIRKNGAGSALLDKPDLLLGIVKAVRAAIQIPLTVKIRIQNTERDFIMAQHIEQAGADALIVHGRRWDDEYDVDCNLEQIAGIKQRLGIPVIANGDIVDNVSLERAFTISGCDGFMIGRAGSGRPWLYQELLQGQAMNPTVDETIALFMQHLQGLANLENEFKAVLQSKSLVRYYFRDWLSASQLVDFYKLGSLLQIEDYLSALLVE